jgi:pyoverdine/dityrosine biosynthesis protein Dit1
MIKRYSITNFHISHKYKGNLRNSGIILTVQKIGIKAIKTITNFVRNEIFESSSQLSFLKVVRRHAKDAKLKMEINGVTIGNTKINKIYTALIP